MPSVRLTVERVGALVSHRYYCGECAPAESVALKHPPSTAKRCDSCRKSVGKRSS